MSFKQELLLVGCEYDPEAVDRTILETYWSDYSFIAPDMLLTYPGISFKLASRVLYVLDTEVTRDAVHVILLRFLNMRKKGLIHRDPRRES